MKDFTDKVAVVTGAGSGIGRALATDLAGRGAKLAISDIDTEGLAATRESCEALGADVHAATLDVTDRDGVFAYADEVETYFGRVNLVVNNAGVALAASALDQTMDDIQRVVDVDWWGVAHGTQAFLPKLVASGDGALVNISSVFGIVAVPGQSAYHAAKFAVRGYTEAIAQEAELDGLPITVHCVHPGGILTNIARNAEVRGDWGDLQSAFDRVARTSPERCAEVILTGVAKRRKRILVGADAWALHLVQQTLGVRGLGLLRRITKALTERAGLRVPTDDTSTRPDTAPAPAREPRP